MKLGWVSLFCNILYSIFYIMFTVGLFQHGKHFWLPLTATYFTPILTFAIGERNVQVTPADNCMPLIQLIMCFHFILIFITLKQVTFHMQGKI